MNRRSLLKALGACMGASWFFKASKAEGKQDYQQVCDPTPIPPWNIERREHNATVVRMIAHSFVLIMLSTGEHRVARDWNGEIKHRTRVVVDSGVGGLRIRHIFFD